MIVGGYSLDLYCDAPGCKNARTDFYGPNQTAAKQEARAKGWSFSKDRRRCFCAEHKGANND
jgi:hypothetical protein